MHQYHVVLVPDDGSYMVLVPSLPDCATFGTSVEDALTMAKEAITLHIEGMVADGEDVPEDEGEPILATVSVEPNVPLTGSPPRRVHPPCHRPDESRDSRAASRYAARSGVAASPGREHARQRRVRRD